MSKHNVQDVEFVKCPYCVDDNKNKFKMLHWKHLKCSHSKTIDDVLRDFPDIPTMTLLALFRLIDFVSGPGGSRDRRGGAQ